MMKKWCNPYGKDFALLVLRIGLGVIFIWHGLDKLGHMDMVIGFFKSLGLPAFIAWSVALIELIGGIFILLGIFTSLASALLAIIMVCAIFLAKFGMLAEGGFPIVEIDIALLCMSTALLMAGAGRFSLGRVCFCCKKGKCNPNGTCPCHVACGAKTCATSDKACDSCGSTQTKNI